MAGDQPITTKIDGRTERRDRNRTAVLDALLDLVEEGNVDPTVPEVSERCGISHRSVFRYFDDLAMLFQEALFHAIKRYRDVSLIHDIGHGPFEGRLSAIIDQRLALFGAVAPLVASARRRQGAFSTLLGQFEAYNLPLRRQVEMQFAIELRALEPRQRELTIAATDAILSFECYEFIIRSAGSDELARPVYRTAVRAIVRG